MLLAPLTLHQPSYECNLKITEIFRPGLRFIPGSTRIWSGEAGDIDLSVSPHNASLLIPAMECVPWNQCVYFCRGTNTAAGDVVVCT